MINTLILNPKVHILLPARFLTVDCTKMQCSCKPRFSCWAIKWISQCKRQWLLESIKQFVTLLPVTPYVCGRKQLHFWCAQHWYFCCQTLRCTQWLIMNAKGSVRRFDPSLLSRCVCVCVNKRVVRGRKTEFLSQYYWTSSIAHHSAKQMKKNTLN